MKNKTIGFTLAIAVLLIFAFALGLGLADVRVAEALRPSLCDEVFKNTLDDLADEYVDGHYAVSANKEIVYDIALNPLGVVYDFAINGERGYAILIDVDGMIEVSEIYFDADNPYAILDAEYPVYVQPFVYVASDGERITTLDGTPLDDQTVEMLAEDAFFGGGEDDLWGSNEYVYYTDRSDNNKLLSMMYPTNTDVSGLGNSCVPIAAGNIITYWDRFCPNLIPNYEPGSFLLTEYLYTGQCSETDAVTRQLYVDMDTNGPNPGTTVEQFKTGIKTFCNRQGYGVTLASCMTGGAFDFGKVKSAIDDGKPLMLFTKTFSAAEIFRKDGYDILSFLNCSATHAMAGFGYNEVTYTLSDGTVRIDKYVAVATGLHNQIKGYCNINATNFGDVLSVTIA